jgi:GNAT superfamily N-acetyltransferase
MIIRRVDAEKPSVAAHLAALQELCFPGDRPYPTEKGWWWLVMSDSEPAAFAAMNLASSWEHTVYMARCGVAPAFRGRGLQRKLLQKREQFAKIELGAIRAITDTSSNTRSANNLIRAGYLTYTPARNWGLKEAIYWLKELK